MPPMAPFAEFDAPAPPTEPVSALDFIKDAASPHVAHLLVASWDNFVRLYDLSSCAEGADKVRVLQSFEHPAAVLDVCWLTDSMAASACLDQRVRLYVLRGNMNSRPDSTWKMAKCAFLASTRRV